MKNAYEELKSLDTRSKELLEVILKHGRITKNKLSDMTNMKKSTLNRSMEALADKELVIEAASGESTGGRKPVLLDVNPKKYYLVGIDFSRTYVTVIIVGLKMDILGERIFNGGFSIKEAILLISKGIRELLNQLSIDISQVIGIGIGVVRYDFNPEDSIRDENSNSLIKRMLEDEIGLPVFIDNGAQTAVMAEYHFGYGKGKGNVSYINCGVGIRTGVMSDGLLIKTINNCEDALGHMIVQMDGEPCTCGNYGCVESYASITRIKDKFVSKVKRGRSTKLKKSVHEIEFIDVCNLAEENDELAREVIIDAALYFGTGLANYIKLLNPNMIILSGPIIQFSPLFYETSRETALKKCSSSIEKDIEFSRGGYFKDKSMAIGAAYLVMNELFKNIKRKI